MAIPVFDAHLDLAWNALSFDRDLTLSVAQLRRREASMTDHPSRGKCTVSLPEMRRARVVACVATLLARSGPDAARRRPTLRTDLDYAAPSIAYAAAQGQLAYYRRLQAEGHVRILLSQDDLRRHWQDWAASEDAPLGVIIGMEGTDPIVSPEQLDEWWDGGLRVAGLAHYGHSRYASGTGVDGPLSPAGLQLLERFQEKGMSLDVTHLCDRSLDQALEAFGGAVLASHHNCRSLVPGDRQLTDTQIRALVKQGAVIGVALDAWMLHPGWQRGRTSPDILPLEAAADHVDHVCQLAGDARHSAIGSDLDGGFGREQTPRELNTIRDLQQLAEILGRRGFSDDEIEAVFHGNWLRFFGESLPH